MKNRLFSLAMAALLVSAAACAKSEEGAEGAPVDSAGATTEAVTPMPVDSAATMAPAPIDSAATAAPVDSAAAAGAAATVDTGAAAADTAKK